MAMSMGPPQLPGYSLRVKLFAPHTNGVNDKPVRCFRVVTSPNVSIREFCEEASRIHEINYGQPLLIKKCQDDEQFDVTQSEILGTLFANTATIRIVQATAQPNIRDSVPPTSALRFDPTNSTGRKRQREGSVAPNSSTRLSSRKPNKRQRVGTVDPDRPLQSRESDQEGNGTRRGNTNLLDSTTIPNSQESVNLGQSAGLRHDRAHGLQIPETPSPSPPPTSGNSSSGDHPATKVSSKTAVPDLNRALEAAAEDTVTSKIETTTRAYPETSKTPRAKSTSYHIQRTTERGASVSTAATTPIPGDDKTPRNNETAARNTRKSSDLESNTGKPNEGKGRRPENEDSIYDDMPSDSESAALMALRKATLKSKKSPASGLPGLDFANGKLNTPPSGSRRTSGSRERLPESPGELQLTPGSKLRDGRAREETRSQKQNTEDVRKARLTAVSRRQEETRILEEKSRKEEEDKSKAKESRQRKAQEAARVLKEREEKETRRAEKERMRKEAHKREKDLKALAEQRSQEEKGAERLEQKRVQEKEAEQVRKAQEARIRQEKLLATIEAKESKEPTKATQANIVSTPRASSAKFSHASATKGTPASASRSRSSTPFIPPGRKSALKSSISSSQAATASPSVQSKSPEAPIIGVGIEDQLPLPKDKSRRISFADGTKLDSPIKPSPTILPPKIRALKSSSPTSTPKASASEPPSQVSKILPPQKQSNSPILPPSMKGLSKDRSTTPATIQKAPAPQSTTERKSPVVHPPAKSTTPIPLPKSVIPTPAMMRKQDLDAQSSPGASSQVETPSRAGTAKGPAVQGSKSVSRPPKLPAEVETSFNDPEEDVPATATVVKAKANSPSSDENNAPAAPKPLLEPEQDEDEEVASNPSSPRESRSPVIFSQHPRQSNPIIPKLSASPPSDGDSKEESEASQSADESDAKSDDFNGKESEVDEEEDEDEEMAEVSEEASQENELSNEIQETTSVNKETSEGDGKSGLNKGAQVEVSKSSPSILPVQRHSIQAAPGPKLTNKPKSKVHIVESSGTQEELDQQLTSSMYEVRPSGIPSSPPNAPPSSTSRPTIKFGASLQSLNSNKPVFRSSNTSGGVASSQPLRRTFTQPSDSEEEPEESDDGFTSSEGEDSSSKRHISSTPRTTSQMKKPTSTSSSDNYTDSDSDSGGMDEITRMRSELEARLRG